MDIVGAYACSHAGLLITRGDDAPAAQRDAVYAAFATMGAEIRALAPDAIVIVGTDHGRIYPLTHVSQFTLGVSDSAEGVGDAGLPQCTIPLHQRFAQSILENIISAGVDMSFSEQMQIDHSFVTPLMLAFPELGAIPIVPIAQNCNVPPLPPLSRSYDVGVKLREAIEAGPAGRVVVIGTGGLSHWVGTPVQQAFRRQPAGTRIAGGKAGVTIDATGPVNESFDRAFLDAMCCGTTRTFLQAWSNERLYDEAGNGAQEIRNFVLLAGVAHDGPARVLAYEAVLEWLTGTAVIGLTVA
jgi:aromatic ring-opening dioxygenase catalytic subunit (LigB family)